MADIDAMIREAERRSALQFDMRPKGPVIAQPYPRFREANAAAWYTSPPLDGSRPGIFQMPLRPDQMTRFGAAHARAPRDRARAITFRSG